jgi:hypothetical protein
MIKLKEGDINRCRTALFPEPHRWKLVGGFHSAFNLPEEFPAAFYIL